jgi:hypothetical protein
MKFYETERLDVLNTVLEATREKEKICIAKQWKYKRHNGDEIVFRDLFTKIASRILKFKKLGDMAVKFDPTGYAAIPWAVVSSLFQLSVNDAQSFGAMIEGVELVVRLTTRYTLIEQFYLQIISGLEHHLTDALVTLYAIVLNYLANAKRFFAKASASESKSIRISKLNPNVSQERFVSGNAQTDVKNFLADVAKAQADVDVYIGFVTAKCKYVEY